MCNGTLQLYAKCNCNFLQKWFATFCKKGLQKTIGTIDDVDDPETQIACKVYDYLMGIDDKPAVEKIMAETKTNDNLFSLAAKAKNLRDSLLKDIDKIAG